MLLQINIIRGNFEKIEKIENGVMFRSKLKFESDLIFRFRNLGTEGVCAGVC